MRILSAIKSFYQVHKPSDFKVDEAKQEKLFKAFGIQTFLAGTIGYSLYYVCRTSLNVVKKPILDSGMLDASQLGVIGSVLLFAYAIGKFINGFLADHCNIKRFMATGLLVSAVANFCLGILGFASSALPTMAVFMMFAIMWGINGWSQSMGEPPAIIGLSRWYPLSKRGTFYGFFSLSHNLGEWLSFLFVGILMSGLSAEITPEEYVSRVENNTITDVLCDYIVQSGDVFFLPAGRIHSIGKGCFIAEIQQTSSEDYRTAYIATQNEETPLVECEYFKTHLLDLTEPMSVEVSSKDSFMIVICLEGNGELTNSEGNVVSLRQGETVLIPAFTDNVVFLPQNKMKLLLTHN